MARRGLEPLTPCALCTDLHVHTVPRIFPEYAGVPWSQEANSLHHKGSVEGACTNLVRDRFERSGMRWSPEMAEAMLKLRAVYLSGDYDAYWEWHIQQDQNRLRPKGQWLLAQK